MIDLDEEHVEDAQRALEQARDTSALVERVPARRHDHY
jgi:hypothetical protein